MLNTDLTTYSDRELELWIHNDEWLNQEWRKTIKQGDMSYIKSALEYFTYTTAQWANLVDRFEEELKEIKKAKAVQTICSNVSEYMAGRNNYGPRLQA